MMMVFDDFICLSNLKYLYKVKDIDHKIYDLLTWAKVLLIIVSMVSLNFSAKQNLKIYVMCSGKRLLNPCHFHCFARRKVENRNSGQLVYVLINFHPKM